MKQEAIQTYSDPITPLHHRVYVTLRQQILEGQYQSNVPMPSENTLSGMFGVSRITMRRALERLQNEELVQRERGRGTFARKGLRGLSVQANLKGIFENLLAMGLRTKVTLVEFGYVSAIPAVATTLDLDTGATVQRAVRVRSHKNVPFSHLTTYLPEPIGRQFEADELTEKPLLWLMERAGVRVCDADQSISAKLADPIVAPLLRVETGSPLIWLKRLVRDHDGKPVEYLQALYRPDIYEYQMKLSRVEGGETTIWSPDANQT